MSASMPQDVLNDIFESIRGVRGYLSHRDVRFLAAAAAFPTATGSIVELSSYKGKSTIVLAKAARLTSSTDFVTVDPMFGGIRPELDQNVERVGVSDEVKVFEMLSTDFIQQWNGPIRFLFHDRANQTTQVRLDVQELQPHFSDGAIIAFHDVLNTSGYRAEVMFQDVLNSDHFGLVGFCRCIGWGQYFSDPSLGLRYRRSRQPLATRLTRMLPFQGVRVQGLQKIHYKLLSSCIPHRQVRSNTWVRTAA